MPTIAYARICTDFTSSFKDVPFNTPTLHDVSLIGMPVVLGSANRVVAYIDDQQIDHDIGAVYVRMNVCDTKAFEKYIHSGHSPFVSLGWSMTKRDQHTFDWSLESAFFTRESLFTGASHVELAQLQNERALL